jgi:hypothetical protein
MELGTYGAIFKFAIEFEQGCAKFYREVGSDWATWATGAEKRGARLDRVRREMVQEMTLEPLVGLRSEDYAVDWTQRGIDAIRAIEETGRRFYVDMAGHISVAEVARTFKKLAEEHETNSRSCAAT